MTARADAEGHPEVEEISALLEDALPPERRTEVQNHVAECEICDDVLESLASIRDLLGAMPGPPRMPADVAGRIDAALAAEALLASAEPSAVSRETATDGPSAVSRETTAPRTGSTAGPPRREDASRGPGRSRRRRRRVMLTAAGCCAALIGIGGIVQSMSPADGAGAKADTAQQRDTRDRSSTFAAGSLEKRVKTLLADQPSEPSKEEPTEFDVRSTASPGALLAEGTAVPPCVQQATQRQETALAAEPGTYRGAEAYLVVLPHAGDADRVDVYVVDSSCTRESTPRPGEVLLTRSYARH